MPAVATAVELPAGPPPPPREVERRRVDVSCDGTGSEEDRIPQRPLGGGEVGETVHLSKKTNEDEK